MNNWIGLYTFIRREIERFLRVGVQTLLSPWINALLYIFIFGFVVGSRIAEIDGISYIQFVMPGLLMLNLITSSFSQTSFSLFYQRFAKHIEELLVSPLSYAEIVCGFVVGGIARGVAVSIGVYAIAILFGAARVEHIGIFALYSFGVAVVFSLIGLVVGLWSENFEQVSIFTTFVIMPFTFLGGVFNSVNMLPRTMQTVVRLNPFFYFVDGLRYSMVGLHEAPLAIGVSLMAVLTVVFGVLVWYLFKIGWKIKS
ncbi:MAG: ABC transporter permease [Candidatus Magasanikbacteria bacterium]|nr:ABC transporter permease [Candidatus Magasanikbacteria bacterium]